MVRNSEGMIKDWRKRKAREKRIYVQTGCKEDVYEFEKGGK